MAQREDFCYETKSSTHLSEWVEWICGVQSLKERRLLSEFVFISVDRRTLIQEKVGSKAVPMKPKHQFTYPNK